MKIFPPAILFILSQQVFTQEVLMADMQEHHTSKGMQPAFVVGVPQARMADALKIQETNGCLEPIR